MDKSSKVTVNITNRTIVRTILWIVAAVAAFNVVGRAWHVIILVFAAFFLALALNPAVSFIRRRLKIESRARATAVAYLGVVVFLCVFFALVIPPLVKQTQTFIKQVPATVSNFQSQDSSLTRTIQKYNLDSRLTEGAKEFASNYSDFGNTLLNTGRRVAEAIASLFAVLVMTFMMLVEGPKWLGLYFGTLPEKKRNHQRKLADRMYKAVSGYVNGQVLLAVVAGSFAFITLEIVSHVLDVPINSVALAGIVAVFGVIPLFGNPIAATLVVLACLLNSVSMAVIMAIYFVVYFFIENHTFQPYIQSRLNELTPLLVFIAAIVGVSLAGILGAIVAIPTASAIKILVEDYFSAQDEKSSKRPLEA